MAYDECTSSLILNDGQLAPPLVVAFHLIILGAIFEETRATF